MRKNSKCKMDSYSLCYVIYHIQCKGKLRERNLMSLHFTHDSSNKVFPFHGKNWMMNFRCVLLRILSLDINACQHMFQLLTILDNSVFIVFYKAYVIFFSHKMAIKSDENASKKCPFSKTNIQELNVPILLNVFFETNVSSK